MTHYAHRVFSIVIVLLILLSVQAPPIDRDWSQVVAAAEGLQANKPDGAQAIIAGCTEIPLALGQQDLSLPYFDSLTILARAAIRRAGVTPVV